MVRQDILGGLRTAVARGETLERAMMTLYSAGYTKLEIEAAARELQKEMMAKPAVVVTVPAKKEAPKVETKKIEKKPLIAKPALVPAKPKVSQTLPVTSSLQKISSYGDDKKVREGIQAAINELRKIQPAEKPIISNNKLPAPVQQVSSYTQQPKKPGSIWPVLILVFLLLLLVAGLVGVLFFKTELVDLFGKLF